MRRKYWLLVGVFLLALLAAWLTQTSALHTCDVGQGSDFSCARNFDMRERAENSSLRWSSDSSSLLFAGAGWGRPMLASVTLRSGRPPDLSPVPVALLSQGQSVQVQAGAGWRRYRWVTPPRYDLTPARITISTLPWSPDGRVLGVLITSGMLISAGIALPEPLLVLSWLALLLDMVVLICLQPSFGKSQARLRLVLALGLPLLLLLVAPVFPLAAYLPWLAVCAGASALLWRRLVLTGSFLPLKAMPGVNVLLLIFTGLLGILLYFAGVLRWLPGSALPFAMIGSAALCLSVTWLLRRIEWSYVSLREALPLGLILATFGMRIAMLMLRLSSERTAFDGDVELFYGYGMRLRSAGLPAVEYPSGALVVWAFMTWLCGDSRERFALFLPVFNAICDALTTAGLLVLFRMNHEETKQDEAHEETAEGQRAGKPESHVQVPRSLSAVVSSLPRGLALIFWIASPLLEPFVFGKFDPLPTVLIIGALALFVQGRYGWSGLLLGVGAAVKWTPLLALPFLAWYLLRRKEWRALALIMASCFGVIALLSLPFALTDLNALLSPYRVQSARSMIGSSIWFLLAAPFDQPMVAHLKAPWGGAESSVMPVVIMVGVQFGLLALLGLLQLLRPANVRRTLVLAALAPAIFLLLNRVFSPQYVHTIVACLLAGFALTPGPSPTTGRGLTNDDQALSAQMLAITNDPPERHPSPLVGEGSGVRAVIPLALIALAEVANLLIWPYLQPNQWMLWSRLLFAALLGLVAWLAVRAARLEAER